MLRRRPDLIVPIRDRRQRKRFLTLKNFYIASAAGVVLFAAITIRSEMRGRKPTAGYGELFQRITASEVTPKPLEVVHEAPAPVEDATHADPMLTAPAARAQWLEDDAATPTATPTATAVAITTAGAAASASGDVAIVGGPGGVTVVQKERKKPLLSGGFGRN